MSLNPFKSRSAKKADKAATTSTSPASQASTVAPVTPTSPPFTATPSTAASFLTATTKKTSSSGDTSITKASSKASFKGSSRITASRSRAYEKQHLAATRASPGKEAVPYEPVGKVVANDAEFTTMPSPAVNPLSAKKLVPRNTDSSRIIGSRSNSGGKQKMIEPPPIPEFNTDAVTAGPSHSETARKIAARIEAIEDELKATATRAEGCRLSIGMIKADHKDGQKDGQKDDQTTVEEPHNIKKEEVILVRDPENLRLTTAPKPVVVATEDEPVVTATEDTPIVDKLNGPQNDATKDAVSKRTVLQKREDLIARRRIRRRITNAARPVDIEHDDDAAVEEDLPARGPTSDESKTMNISRLKAFRHRFFEKEPKGYSSDTEASERTSTKLKKAPKGGAGKGDAALPTPDLGIPLPAARAMMLSLVGGREQACHTPNYEALYENERKRHKDLQEKYDEQSYCVARLCRELETARRRYERMEEQPNDVAKDVLQKLSFISTLARGMEEGAEECLRQIRLPDA